MTYVYVKRGRWYAGIKSRGRLVQKALGLDVESHPDWMALEEAKRIEEKGLPLTVAEWADTWLESRRALRSHADDVTRIRKHVLPHIGAMEIEDVRAKHIRRMAETWTLAPRTQHTVIGLVRKMFADAVYDEMLDTNPCPSARDLKIPAKRDADPSWRIGAVYTREEVERLLAETPYPWRLLYGLLFLAGLRVGEAVALRWKDWDPEAKPLGKLTIARSYDSNHCEFKTTKSGLARLVPVHDELFCLMMGAPVGMKSSAHMLGRLYNRRKVYAETRKHFAELDIRPRRVHDARRTFVSLLRADGAAADIVQLISHGPSRSMLDAYTTLPWEVFCREIAKLEIGGHHE